MMFININSASESDLKKCFGLSKSQAKYIYKQRTVQPGRCYTEQSFRLIFAKSQTCMELLSKGLIWFGPPRVTKTQEGQKVSQEYFPLSP